MTFKLLTKSVLSQAETYAELLVVTGRGSRNIEVMTDNLEPKDYHRIQHFISESPWSARDLMDSVTSDVNELLKNEPAVGLLIDESSEEKKGNYSVGVSHQYCGSLGKLANCQVAVYGTLSAGEHFSIVDTELYLPENWTKDDTKRKKAGVPKEIIYKKKADIALGIVKRQKELGTRIDYIAADALYGNDSDFRKGIDDLDLLFVVDVKKETKIYTEKYEYEIPENTGKRGKKAVNAKPNKTDISLNKYLEGLKKEDWQQITIRNGCKGALISQIHSKTIFIEEKGICVKRTLLIRKTKEHNKERIHFIISNGSLEGYDPAVLAGYQAQRFYIEQSFREAKQNIGMCEYQVRGWLAWHHHMAMSIMALAFLSMEKMNNQKALPLLSYRDIRDAIIDNYIQEEYQKPFEEKLRIRHQKRQQDINRYYPDPNLLK